MKLTPPKQVTWFIALALAVLGLLGYLDIIKPLTQYAFWFALVAAALLLLATLIKDL